MVVRCGELYLQAKRALEETEAPADAGKAARELLCMATGKTRETLLANRNAPVTEAQCEKLRQAVHRIKHGEPLAYVLGEWGFYGLPLYVTKDVLIPRDDTCAVAELAIKKALFLDADPRVLDLCCGTGCIGLAIASRVKDAHVTLADISKEALAVAKKNIRRNHLGGRVSTFPVDARLPSTPFLGKFDLLVSNPPYVTREEMKTLPDSVRCYEPYLALDGGEDGLDFYRAICANFKEALKPGGYICFEFGMGQGDAVCGILQDEGYSVLERTEDNNQIERAVLARSERMD